MRHKIKTSNHNRRGNSPQITNKMLKGLRYEFFDSDPLNTTMDREKGVAELQHRLPAVSKQHIQAMAEFVTQNMDKPFHWLLNVAPICIGDDLKEYETNEISIEDFCPIQDIFDNARDVISEVLAEQESGIYRISSPFDTVHIASWRVRCEILGLCRK